MSPEQDTSWKVSTALHHVSPQNSSTLKNCCSNCGCGSAQLVQQQMQACGAIVRSPARAVGQLPRASRRHARASSNTRTAKKTDEALTRTSQSKTSEVKPFLCFRERVPRSPSHVVVSWWSPHDLEIRRRRPKTDLQSSAHHRCQ